MKISKLVITLLIVLPYVNSSAQDYFIVGNDTTFCKNLKYGTTMQGYLKSISYVNSNGDEIKIEGRKNVPDVLTFYKDSATIDKIPLKASKPNSYVRYIERSVDGKLKTYSNAFTRGKSAVRYTPGSAPTPSHPGGNWSGGGTMGQYHFNIKMPDGTFYDINNKNIKKYIKPFLLKCEEFKKQYKGEYKNNETEFNEMIELYNSLCGK